MQVRLACALLVGLVCGSSLSAFAEPKKSPTSGQDGFALHCAMCHPDGGNAVNPRKTLHKKDRDAFGVKSKTDIIRLIRNPGPGMMKYDVKAISEQEADAIAEYVLRTF